MKLLERKLNFDFFKRFSWRHREVWDFWFDKFKENREGSLRARTEGTTFGQSPMARDD